MRSIRTAEMARLLGVTPQTIRKYVETGQIPYHKTVKGRLFFTENDIQEALGESPQSEKKTVHYARSSSGDKKAIENQFSKLKEYYGEPDITISDKASGLNENRKGIKRLINLAQSRDITDIYMVRKDRLTRFGYKYLEALFAQNGVALHSMTSGNSSTIEQELLDDFMAIIASFSGKYSQLRSQEAKKKLLNKALENVEGESND